MSSPSAITISASPLGVKLWALCKVLDAWDDKLGSVVVSSRTELGPYSMFLLFASFGPGSRARDLEIVHPP